jgi:hypothetical protein
MSERQQRNVWIAIPAYTGTIHMGTMRSLITDLLLFADRGDKVTIFDESGNAMIGDCRGLIVAKFLEGEGTDLIFIDSDVAWEAGALLRLVDQPVDFVAGIYPQRKDPLNFCVQYIQERGELWADPKTGLLEVAGVPAGCMRLSRAMLQRMVEAYPDTAFHCTEAKDNTVWDLFGAYREPTNPKIKYGEDYSFCRRWRDLGGQIWVDADMRMGHIGYKTFLGSLGDWLRNRPDDLAAQVSALNAQLDQLETAA